MYDGDDVVPIFDNTGSWTNRYLHGDVVDQLGVHHPGNRRRVRGVDGLWVRYKDAKDDAAKKLVRRPESVHAERVYARADLNLLGN